MTAQAAEEIGLLADSAARFGAACAGPLRARRLRDDAIGFDAHAWRQIVELGWLGIFVPETEGGLGLGPDAACVVAEAAGRSLLMPPLTMAMASAGFLASCDDEHAQRSLAALLDGGGRIGLAACGANDGDGSRSALVSDGDALTGLIAFDGAGAAFEARLIADDILTRARSQCECVDGSRLSTLSLTPAAWDASPVIARGESGGAQGSRATSVLRLCDAAYLCGLADAALHLALDYLRLRKQFGAPLGSFQALQHRAADCHIALRASEALYREAGLAPGTPRQDRAAALAIVRARSTALHVTKECVQFHGAIGFADEHDAGLYLRRAVVVAARHADALAELTPPPAC